MTVFVALLRGINVGGRSKLAMADLRRITEGCGYEDVRTYVQSGNVVFRAGGSAQEVGRRLRAALESQTGRESAVATRTAAQLGRVVDGCPFDDTASVHVTFLVDGAAKAAPPALDPPAFEPERFVTKGREVYLYLPGGIGRSRLAQALSRGNTDGTTRNWRTVTTLRSMAAETG
jgi:uncharacterized protein (DUF1697 family)